MPVSKCGGISGGILGGSRPGGVLLCGWLLLAIDDAGGITAGADVEISVLVLLLFAKDDVACGLKTSHYYCSLYSSPVANREIFNRVHIYQVTLLQIILMTFILTSYFDLQFLLAFGVIVSSKAAMKQLWVYYLCV